MINSSLFSFETFVVKRVLFSISNSSKILFSSTKEVLKAITPFFPILSLPSYFASTVIMLSVSASDSFRITLKGGIS